MYKLDNDCIINVNFCATQLAVYDYATESVMLYDMNLNISVSIKLCAIKKLLESPSNFTYNLQLF